MVPNGDKKRWDSGNREIVHRVGYLFLHRTDPTSIPSTPEHRSRSSPEHYGVWSQNEGERQKKKQEEEKRRVAFFEVKRLQDMRTGLVSSGWVIRQPCKFSWLVVSPHIQPIS